MDPNSLLVHEVQRGNPLLAHVKNVKWCFSKDIIPDYVMNNTCVVFVSVKYHFKHPKHILRRIDEIGKNFRFRVLLVLVDDENNLPCIQELNKIAFTSNFTLILSWSNLECARYLESFRYYEGKPTSSLHIQEKSESEYLPKLTQVLTNIRPVNKTDVLTLLDAFGNFRNICKADEQQLVLCPGLGDKKVRRLFEALHEPFNAKPKKTIDSIYKNISDNRSNKNSNNKDNSSNNVYSNSNSNNKDNSSNNDNSNINDNDNNNKDNSSNNYNSNCNDKDNSSNNDNSKNENIINNHDNNNDGYDNSNNDNKVN